MGRKDGAVLFLFRATLRRVTPVVARRIKNASAVWVAASSNALAVADDARWAEVVNDGVCGGWRGNLYSHAVDQVPAYSEGGKYFADIPLLENSSTWGFGGADDWSLFVIASLFLPAYYKYCCSSSYFTLYNKYVR